MPANSIPAKRPADEIMGEILELARVQASYRERTQFLDAYIPTFQQFLPLLQQVVTNANRPSVARQPMLGHPRDTSLERTSGESLVLNTFGFPRELKNALPIDPDSSGRRLDLVQMNGGSGMVPEGPFADIHFILRGKNLASGTLESYDIYFTLEIATARKIALYLEQIADSAEQGQVRFMQKNIRS